jgi:hypothetical protein
MILAFKTTFPNGEKTGFDRKILEDIKIHTLRQSDRIRKGTLLNMATGVRTKSYNQFNIARLDLQTCTGREKIFMTYDRHCLEITVGSKYMMQHEIQKLIANDGLTKEQFLDWFFPKDVDEWSGYIIHWTDFKYDI